MARDSTLMRPAAQPFYIGSRPSNPREPARPGSSTKKTAQVSELYQRLKAVRRFAELKQQDLANACRKSRSLVTLWESVDPKIRVRPIPEDLSIIARLARVPVEFLLDDSFHPEDVWNYEHKPAGAEVAAPAANDAAARAKARTPGALPPALLGMDDRRTQGFWCAVEFELTEYHPELRECFMQGERGVVPDFVHNDNAVVFASDSADPRSALIGALSILLGHEKEKGRAFAKHILVFAGTGQNQINEAEAERQFGASVRVFDHVRDAAKYLQVL